MELLPAIDLRGGRCVRLLKGDYNAETVYGDDPVAVARAYEAAGARWIHVVDLDAARTGEQRELANIAAICAAVGCSVEASGGVRSLEASGRLFEAGVTRVVIGTAAIEDPQLVVEACLRWPGRIAVGLDVRSREVAVRGWEQSAGVSLTDATHRFADSGVAAIIATQIERDGLMAGPDVELYRELLAITKLDVIASGGVSSLDDLRALDALTVDGRIVAGVIVGRALYEGAFDVEEAIACLRPV